MASTYLSRSVSSTGNRRKWTFSAWLKRAVTSAQNYIFTCNNGSNQYAMIGFNNDGRLRYYDYTNTYQSHVATNRLFRDTNAFYHVVVIYDSAQSTSSDRIKFYVNGVQETSFETASYPSQDHDSFMNLSGLTMNIGRETGTTNLYNGIMSHVHFSDGYAYDASTFGETDSTTGEWKIKTSPSFTLGTNGFTVLKDGNTITDQSSNSNDFSLSAGTLTKTEDNPSNVFATMNPLNVPTSNAPSFSYGNTKTQTAGTSGRFGGTSTLGMAKGKFYIEAKAIVDATYSRNCIGICYNPVDQARNNDTHYSYSDGWSYNSETGAVVTLGTTFYTASTYTTGDIIQMAIDCDNWKLYYGKNGTWLNSGDPTSGSTGTGSVSLTADKTYFVIQSDNTGTSSPSTFEFNFGNGYFGSTQISSAGTNASGNGIFEYDVPTGYTALSTKGLNL